MRRLALIAAMSLVLAGASAAAPPPSPQPAPTPPSSPNAPPDPGPAPAPPAPGGKHCTMPDGGVRVLTLKQKKCRQANACSCADPCPPCP